MTLDTSSPTPLYQQLQDLLRQEISSKVRKPGDRLPSEHELCHRFGITRPTVRQALEGLVREGLVRKHRGRGAFVTEPPPPVGLFSLADTSDAFAGQQITVETQVLRLERAPVCPLAEGGDPPEGWVALERMRRINNVPTFYEHTWLHAELVPGLEQVDFRDSSLFAVLAEKFNLRPDGGRQRFSAVSAPPHLAAALGLKAGVPLLRVVRSVRLCSKSAAGGSSEAASAVGILHTDLYVAPGPLVLEENIPSRPAVMKGPSSLPQVQAVRRTLTAE